MDERTREPLQDHAPRTSTRATTGAATCRCSAPWASISRSASITAACTATGSAARKPALEKSELGALLLFDDNNIRYVTSTKIGEWARDKLSRWTLLIRGQRSDPVGLRLGRRPPQALFAVAQAGELQGRPGRPARHRRSGVRPDEAPRRGDGLDPQGRRRRQDADRRRHHRAADDVRTGEGRPQDQGRPAGHAERARGEVGRRDRAAQPRRRDGRRRL